MSAPPPPPPLPAPGPASSPPAVAAGRAAPATKPPARPPGGEYGPEDAAQYRFLLGHYERKGERDAAYRAALCLDALGEADINESLLVTTHRPEGLQAVRGTFSYADWNQRLCVGHDDAELTALLRTLSPVLPRVGFQQVRRQRRDVELPEEARQDLERSTTMLAKTLLWASRLLCVPATELYVLPELPSTIGLVPHETGPIPVCSRELGSGFSLPELVFLWARELAFARPDAAALTYFTDAEALAQLLLAAMAVAGAVNMRSIDGDAKRVASSLKREVRGAELAALQSAAERLSAAEVPQRAAAFVRSAEVVAARAGLVACGSLEVALKLSQRFPRAAVIPLPERRADLLRFTMSAELGQIRAALGVAVG